MQTKLPRSLPARVRRELEACAISYGHDGEAYLGLMRDLIDALHPRDVVEQILIRQAGDHAWNVSRLRQIENTLLVPKEDTAQNKDPVAHMDLPEHFAYLHQLELITQNGGYKNNVEYWAQLERFEPEKKKKEAELRTLERKRDQAIEERRQLAANTPTPEALASSFVRNSAHLEKIGRAIALSEARFQAILKELERYRAAKANSNRGRPENIVDAQFTEVSTRDNVHEISRSARGK
jgi:hypothetical protein